MTNKQTIDGVSRELLEQALLDANRVRFDTDKQVIELRALLDNSSKHETCKNCDGEFVIRTGVEESPVTLCNHCDGTGSEPAAQPQGEVEPMAYLCRNARHPIPSLRTQWEPITVAYAQARMHNKALAEKGKADEYHLGDELQPLFTSAEPKPAGEPIEHLIACDRHYRNGLMTGFNFGITGNETVYANCVARYNSGIKEARAELAEPKPRGEVVAIDDNVEFEKWWRSTPILRKQKIQIAQEAWFARAKLADQPAPSHSGDANEMVAKVVLPERKPSGTWVDDGSGNGSCEWHDDPDANGYNAAIDDVAKLNVVKP